jgi:tape measure domain-containing protein
MRFDNKEFEKNVSTTMSSLDKLKEKLRLKDASKGFEDVNSAAKKVNMTPLANSVEAVRVRFSALQILGVTAMQDLANTAVQTGKRIASALTIDPVRTGFSEYETQIGSIQTILANTQSKGTTLDDVNKALDTLNTYADKTIYNFTEMTRNIGTFTAAGIDLQTSVNAIQGIANLAAVSGSTSQQASTAMYQLSQALASGTVKLMDWNSVVNAGMGGQVFQDALKETARIHGVAIDEMIEKNGSFRETLHEEWLTADILTETLEKFTMATEGATKAEIEANRAKLKSIGYTDEQIEGIFELANTANGAATKVKTFTQLWDTLKESAQSGWTQTWELIVGDFNEAQELLTGISDVIGGFINKTSEWRNNLLGGALSPYSKLVEKINEAGVSTGAFEEKFASVAKSQGVAVDDLIKKHGSLKKAIMEGEFSTSTFVETLKQLSGASSGSAEATEDNLKKLEEYQKLFDEVWNGDWGNGVDRINKMTEAGHDYAKIQDLINEHEAGHKLTLEDLNKVLGENTNLTDEQISAMQELAKQAEETGTPINELIDNMEKRSGRVLIIESFKNAFSGLFTVLGQVGAAWKDTFDPITSNHLYKAIVAINTFSQNLTVSTEQAKQFKRVFKGVFALLDAVLTIVGGPLKWGFDALITVIKNTNLPILELAAQAGDALVAFSAWVKENNIFLKALEKLTPYLSVAADAIKVWVDGLKEAENIPAYIASSIGKGLGHIVKFVMNLFSSLGDYIKGGMKEIPGNIISGLVNGLKGGLGKVGETIINLGRVLIESFMSVLGIHSPSKVFFMLGGFIIAGLVRGLMHAFPEAWDTIKSFAMSLTDKFGERFQNGFNGILGDFKTFGSKLKDIISRLDFGTIFVGGLYVSVMYTATKIANALATLAAPFDGLGDMFRDVGVGLKKLFKSMSGFFQAAKWRMMSGAIINLAIAVAILAASVYALSTIKDTKSLWNAVGAISALALVMTGLMIAVSKFAAVDVKGVAALASIALIAGALLIMVFVLKQIETLDSSKLIGTIAIFIGIMASLLLLTKAVGKFTAAGNPADIAKAHIIMLGMAAMMLVMTHVMKKASQLDDSGILKAIIMMGTITSMIILLGLTSRIAGEHAETAGKMLLKMAFALGVMVLVVKLASMLKAGTVIKGMVVLAAISTMFGTFIALSYFAGEHADKAGTMLIKIGVAMGVMAIAIAIIGKIKIGEIVRAIGTIAAIGILFALFIAVSYFAGEHADKAGAMLLKLSVAMLILSGALLLISLLDAKGVETATKAILALGTMFALIIGVSYFADHTGAIVAITVALAVLVGALIALTFINPEKLVAPVLTLITLMGALAGLMFTLKFLGNIKINIGPIITIAAIVTVLAGLMMLLAHLTKSGDVDNAMEAAVSISAVMAALAITLKLISSAGGGKDVYKAMLALIVLSPVIILLGFILKALNAMEIGSSIETILNISILMLILSACLKIVGTVGMSAVAAAVALAVLSFVILELGAILAIISSWNITTSLETIAGISLLLLTMSACLVVLGLVGALAGTALLGIAVLAVMSAVVLELGAILAIISSWNITTSLSTMLGIAALITAMSLALIPLSAVGALAPFALAGIAVLAAFAGAIALIAVGISAGLVELGKGIKQFSDELTKNGGIDKEAIETATEVIDPLVEVAGKLKGVGWLKQVFTGDNGLGRFGAELAELGPHLVAYSKAITENGGIDNDAIKDSATAIEGLVTIASSLKGVGWLKQVFTGDNGLGRFGEELLEFGTFLGEYSGVLTEADLNEDKLNTIKKSGEAIEAFGRVAGSLQGIGGLKTIWSGDNSLTTFGTQLKEFAGSLVGYHDKLVENGGIDISVIENSAKAAQALVDMYASTPEFGGFVSWFTADHDMTEFGLQLQNFGNGIASFATSTANINEKTIEPAANAAKALVDMYASTPEFGGFVSWFTADRDLTNFGKQLENFGGGIALFALYTMNITEDSVAGGVDAAKKLAEMYEVMPMMNGLFDGFGEHKNLKDFSKQIGHLADGMNAFIEEAGTINVDAIAGPVAAAETLMELAGKIPYHVTDNEAIESFGDQLKDLAKGLKGYSDKISDMDTRAVSLTESAVKKIVGITSIITPESVKYTSAFSAQLIILADAVKKVGEANAAGDIESFASALPGLAESLKNFGDVAPEINTAGLESITEFLNNIDELNGKAKTAGKNLGQALLDGIGEKMDLFKTKGKVVVTKFSSGIESMRKTLVSMFKNMVGACATGAMDKRPAFVSAGSNLTLGFGAGIMHKKSAAVAAARNVANACAAIMRSALDEHSPSRVTYEIGEYFGQGFVNGIDAYASKTYDSAYSVADAAKDGLNTAMSKMKDIFGLDLENIQPRIKPILDLSDIRAGAGSIPGLLNFGPSVGVLANVNDTAVAMRAINQNKNNNDDLLDAIDNLRKDLKSHTSTSYNINGMTYNDDASLKEAFETIIRVARMGRRT